MTDIIQPGDQVLLALDDHKTLLVRMQAGKRYSMHQGTIAHDDAIGRTWGDVLSTSSGKSVYLLRPRGIDFVMKIRRHTNIMYPKDMAHLLTAMDVRSGQRVVEIGCGSGAMTMALSRAVAPGGQVYAYDCRPEHLTLARDNCANVGITDVVFRERDPGDSLEPGVDAIFTDIPEPWHELSAIHEALRGSGRYGAGVPTYNQAEKLVAALEQHGFVMVETVEVLQRSILARVGKTRPAHRMAGHTQLLVTAVAFNCDGDGPS